MAAGRRRDRARHRRRHLYRGRTAAGRNGNRPNLSRQPPHPSPGAGHAGPARPGGGPGRLGAERFPEAGKIYESAGSMTKVLAHHGVRDYRRASTRVTAAIVDAIDAARLDLALGRPILVVDSTDVDADGRPLLTTRARFAAERVEFVVENG